MRHAWPQKVPEAAADALGLGKERKDCGLGVGTKTKVCVVSVWGQKRPRSVWSRCGDKDLGLCGLSGGDKNQGFPIKQAPFYL